MSAPVKQEKDIPAAPDHDESWADTGSHMMRAGSEQWHPVVTVAPGQEVGTLMVLSLLVLPQVKRGEPARITLSASGER